MKKYEINQEEELKHLHRKYNEKNLQRQNQ